METATLTSLTPRQLEAKIRGLMARRERLLDQVAANHSEIREAQRALETQPGNGTAR